MRGGRSRTSLRALAVLLAGSTAAPAAALTDEQLADHFKRTVFDAEYLDWGRPSRIVKKFTGPVRFHVDNRARIDRSAEAREFLESLPGAIRGLDAAIVEDPGAANYRVLIVDRAQYEAAVREVVYRGRGPAPGRCLVRVVLGPDGIARSDAVIVADEGDFLFRRCLVEEVLQGLGPVNDDPGMEESVFNDASQHAEFTPHDRFLLNMLYDPRVKAGMSESEVDDVLSEVIRDARDVVR